MIALPVPFMWPGPWPIQRMFKLNRLQWIFGTACFAIIPLIFWHVHNSAYPLNWDSAHYLNDAFTGYTVLKNEGLLAFLKSALLTDRHWRGTLTPILFSPLLLLFQGKILLTSLVANVIFFITLSVALFKINQIYLKDYQNFLLTVVLMNTPWVFGSGFYYMSELLYFSFSAWSLYFWLQSEYGESGYETKWSLAFFSLSLMTRPLESLLFLGLLFIASLVREWRKHKIALRDLGLFLLAMIGLVLHLFLDYQYDFNLTAPFIKAGLFIEANVLLFLLCRYLRKKSALLFSLTLSMQIVFSWYFLESKKFIGWLLLSTFGAVSNFQSEYKIMDYGWNPGMKLLISVGLFPFLIMIVMGLSRLILPKKKLELPKEVLTLTALALLLPMIGLLTNNDETRLYFFNFIIFTWAIVTFFLINFEIGTVILMVPLIVYFKTNLDIEKAPGFQFKKELTLFGFSPHIWPPRQAQILEDFLSHFNQIHGRIFFFMTEPLEESGLLNEINPLIATVVSREHGRDLNFEDLVNHKYQDADFYPLLDKYSYILTGPDFQKMRFVKKSYKSFAQKLFADPNNLAPMETFQILYKGRPYLFLLYKVKKN